MKIAVLGGGISGITVAKLLHESGYSPVLFEQEDELGGLCRSKTVKGFVYDLSGGHIVFSKNKKVLDFMLQALPQDEWHTCTRNTKIYFDGNFIKYPFENGLAGLSKTINYECTLGYLNNHYSRLNKVTDVPGNFKDWIYYRFGDGIADHFMIPYNQKIWNYDLSDMSTDWVEGRVPYAPIEDVIKSSIGLETEGYTHQSTFWYPLREGFGNYVKSLADNLPDVRLKTPVTHLEQRDNQWIVNGTEIFDDIISTLPVYALFKALSHGHRIDPQAQEALERLRFNSVVTILIGSNQPALYDYSWIYLPHPENGPANRITYLSNYSPYNAPVGCSSLLVEITFPQGQVPVIDQEFIKGIVKDMDRMGFMDEKTVIVTDSFVSQYAYPVYDLHFKNNFHIIETYLASLGVKYSGRFAKFAYINSDQAVEQAMEAVQSWYNLDLDEWTK